MKFADTKTRRHIVYHDIDRTLAKTECSIDIKGSVYDHGSTTFRKGKQRPLCKRCIAAVNRAITDAQEVSG